MRKAATATDRDQRNGRPDDGVRYVRPRRPAFADGRPPALPADDSHRVRPRVTVVGAGIAGLVAAYELEQLGYQVEILEGSRRLGGRIYTHRFGSHPDAPYAELGAMRIPTKHRHTMGYLRRLGLEEDLLPFRSLMADENALLGTADGYVRFRDAARTLLDDLRTGLSHNGYREETLLFGAWLSVIVNAIAPPGQRESLRRDLSVRLLDLVQGLDVRPYIVDGPRGQVDLHAAFAAFPSLREACTGDLGSFLDDILTETSPELVRLRGGMNRMVDRLARRIRGPILCGREVVGLHVMPDGVLMHVRDGGRIVARCSDYVVCTAPLPLLRRMSLSGLPDEKLDAIRAVQYVPATKIAFHCREPFWEELGITGGASCSGGRIRQTYYPAVDGDPALGSVLLASYTIGEDAEVLGRMPAPARYTAVLTELAQMHPQLLRTGMVLNAVSVAWGQYRWSGSGCSVRWGLDADAADDLRLRVASPVGGLFFAGEHCSSSPAWIDGAIESAHEAVAGIVHDGQRQPAIEAVQYAGALEG
nr:EspO-like indole-3-pyruvic acid imine synthase [uncultured bacterium]